MNKALILIDFQNEWIDKDSDYYVGNIDDVLERNNKLIEYCRDKGYKIIFTQHVESESEDAFAPGSDNIKFIPEIKKQPQDILITKNKISPYYKTAMEDELRGIEEIIVTGILTNLCVRSMIQDAYDRDLEETREKINFVNLDEFISNLYEQAITKN